MLWKSVGNGVSWKKRRDARGDAAAWNDAPEDSKTHASRRYVKAAGEAATTTAAIAVPRGPLRFILNVANRQLLLQLF